MEDVKRAYVETDGSIGGMMNHIPHSTHDDETRFIVIVSKLIQEGTLPLLPEWESSTKDEKAKLVRKKQGQKEAKEAEELAKELGVWDEFYGSGKAGTRKGKGGGKGKGKAGDESSDAEAGKWWRWLLSPPVGDGSVAPAYKTEERSRSAGWGPRNSFGGSIEEWGV